MKSPTAPQGESELERVPLGTINNPPRKSGESATGENGAQEPAAPTKVSPAAAPEITLDDCRAWASDGWGMAFGELEESAPWLKYPDEVKQRAVDKTAPVLFKYRDKLPDWFIRFREEIELGMFLGGMIFGGVKVYRDAKAAAEARKNQPKPVTDGDQKPQVQQPAKPQPVADGVTRTA